MVRARWNSWAGDRGKSLSHSFADRTSLSTHSSSQQCYLYVLGSTCVQNLPRQGLFRLKLFSFRCTSFLAQFCVKLRDFRHLEAPRQKLLEDLLWIVLLRRRYHLLDVFSSITCDGILTLVRIVEIKVRDPSADTDGIIFNPIDKSGARFLKERVLLSAFPGEI